MATDRARVRTDSPISDGAMGGFSDILAEKELLLRKRMEEIISFQEQLKDLKITRVEQLIDRLKDACLPAHGTNNYRGQLATEFKKPKEHVLDYFSRVRSLTQSIIDEESKQVGRLERSVERKIEEEGLDAFIRGLPSDYRTALRFERYTDFSSALICLLLIDKQIQEDAKRTASPTYRSRVAGIGQIREMIVCNHCKKQGHKEDNCWLKKKSGRNLPSSSNSSNKSANRRKGHCNYCKKLGHWKYECRLLKYNNDKRKNQNQGNDGKGPAADARRSPSPIPRPKSPQPKPERSQSSK
ncbi:hypothetical protein M0804_015090 [Polistes exclamans]|nr:hypothetical protein M0804_015090 [Polistes exclamans]